MEHPQQPFQATGIDDLFADNGNMGTRIEAFDWSVTSIGPAETWPLSWKTTLQICLGCSFPAFLWGGADRLLFYNDAGMTLLGSAKHPQALGRPVQEVWPEFWLVLSPLFEQVQITGSSTTINRHKLRVEDNGKLREIYLKGCLNPLWDEQGSVFGIVGLFQDITSEVRGECRQQTLQQLALISNPTVSQPNPVSLALEALASNPDDIPFAQLYSLDSRGQFAPLAGPLGIDSPHLLQSISLNELVKVDLQLPVVQMLSTGILDRFDGAGENQPQFTLAFVPFIHPETQQPVGFFVVGISPYHPFDDGYRQFLQAVAQILTQTFVNFGIFESDCRHCAELHHEIDAVQQRLTNILESLTDGFASFDRQWNYTYVNTAAAQMVNKLPVDLIGKNVWEVFPESINSRFYQAYHQAVSQQKLVTLEEFYPPFNKWFEIRAYPSVEGLSVYYRDITESKKIEEELYRQQYEFRTLIDNAPDIIARIDLQGRYLYVNQAVRHSTGLSPEDFIGKTSLELGFPEELCQLWEQKIQDIIETHQECVLENPFPTPQGLQYYESSLAPEFSRDGSLISIMGVTRNITEKKQFELALQQSNQTLQILIQSSPLAIIVLDREGTVQMWSPAAENMFGWKDSEVLGKPIPFVPKNKLQEFQILHHRKLQGESLKGIELSRQKQSGEAIEIAVWAAPLPDASGHIDGTMAMVADITARKHAEFALQKERDFIETILNTIASLVIVLNRQGQIIQFNKACQKTTGYTLDEVQGRYFWDILLLPEEVAKVREVFESLPSLENGNIYENYWVTKDGEYRLINWKNAVLFDENHRVEYIIGTGTDVTELRQAEKALQKSEAQFRRLAESNIIGIIFANFNGQITEANDIFLKMLGYSREELKAGQIRWDQMTPPEYAALDQQKIAEITRTGSCTPWEKEYIGKEGRRVHILVGISLLDELPDTCICFVIDITERKQAETALQFALQKLNFHVENTPLAVVEWNHEFRVRRWSASAERLFGWTPEDVFYKHPTEWPFVFAEDAQAVNKILSGLLDGSETRNISRNRNYRKDGSVVECEWYNSALCDKQGNLISVLSLVLDVTERSIASEKIIYLNRALQRRVKELQTLLDVIPIGIAIAEDHECRQIKINPALAKLLGLQTHDNASLSVPQRAADFSIYQNGRQLALEELPMRYAATHGVEILDFEVDIQHRDRRIVKLVEYAAPLFDEEGQSRGSVGVFLDITERKATEEALRLSEERYRSLAEALPQLVCLSRPDGIIEYCNQRWFDYTGLTLEQTQNSRGLQHIHPQDRQSFLTHWRQALATGQSYSVEFRLRRYDGIYRWHLANTVPIKTEDGRIMAWLGTATDTDDQRRNQEQERFLAEVSKTLAHSLDYQTTLESVARLMVPRIADWCAIDIVDKTEASLERLAVAHINPEKVALAWELHRRYPPDLNLDVGVAKVLRTSQSELYPEIPDELLVYSARDEEHLRILRELQLSSALCVPLVARGRTLGVITLVREGKSQCYEASDLALVEELAQRSALAVDNARLYKEAQEANRLKDEFLATLSHELRTPLNSILGWAQILRTRSLSAEKISKALETIERNARNQSQLIEDLLDVSRIITGKLRLNVEQVNLMAVIDAALDSVRPALESKGLQLVTALDPNLGPVAGDSDRLQQVVWNLLSNAIKFTPPGGRISVSLICQESEVELEVSDTGQGITPEFLPFVFERFRQADGSTTRAFGGLGLGLTIVQYLTELHGGSVSVFSAGKGQGATFTVRLPLMLMCYLPQESESDSLTTDPRLTTAPSLEGLRVLVVDDEGDTREFLTIVLEDAGAQVLAATSVPEALAALPVFEPDVLISDIAMPFEDGYSLIRKVRAMETNNGKSLPAAALTAYARDEDRTQALLAGFQLHVPKPLSAAELRAVVATLAERVNY
jgi:PAS domain S-box-containing protein